jgi:hypothetical protein
MPKTSAKTKAKQTRIANEAMAQIQNILKAGNVKMNPGVVASLILAIVPSLITAALNYFANKIGANVPKGTVEEVSDKVTQKLVAKITSREKKE